MINLTADGHALKGESLLVSVLVELPSGIMGSLSWQDHSDRTELEVREDFLVALLQLQHASEDQIIAITIDTVPI